jgi:TetR/AcrR family transcriptional regulator, cholesterol catabolism regulator
VHQLSSRAEHHARHARAAGLRRLPPLSLSTSRRALARAEILTAAAELFRARGYRAATLEELARRLGMSKKTLYGHFRSKEDLLAAIFHRTMTLVEVGLATIRASRAAPAEQLREVIRHQVRTVVAEQDFLTVFFAEEANLPARLRRSIVGRKARYDRAIQTIVARAGRRSRLTAPPRLVVFGLLGMSNWVHRWYDPRGEWNAKFIADAFIGLLEHGYRVTAEGNRGEVGRRLAALQTEIRALRPLLEKHAEGDIASARWGRAETHPAITARARCLRGAGRGFLRRRRRR